MISRYVSNFPISFNSGNSGHLEQYQPQQLQQAAHTFKVSNQNEYHIQCQCLVQNTSGSFEAQLQHCHILHSTTFVVQRGNSMQPRAPHQNQKLNQIQQPQQIYVSTDGANGTGNICSNQQTNLYSGASAVATPAVIPPTIYIPSQPVVLPPTQYLHFPGSRLPNFSGFQYFVHSPMIPSLPNPVMHNPGVPALPAGVKKRKHALPIIHPVTKLNVLENFQGAPNSDTERQENNPEQSPKKGPTSSAQSTTDKPDGNAHEIILKQRPKNVKGNKGGNDTPPPPTPQHPSGHRNPFAAPLPSRNDNISPLPKEIAQQNLPKDDKQNISLGQPVKTMHIPSGNYTNQKDMKSPTNSGNRNSNKRMKGRGGASGKPSFISGPPPSIGLIPSNKVFTNQQQEGRINAIVEESSKDNRTDSNNANINRKSVIILTNLARKEMSTTNSTAPRNSEEQSQQQHRQQIPPPSPQHQQQQTQQQQPAQQQQQHQLLQQQQHKPLPPPQQQQQQQQQHHQSLPPQQHHHQQQQQQHLQKKAILNVISPPKSTTISHEDNPDAAVQTKPITMLTTSQTFVSKENAPSVTTHQSNAPNKNLQNKNSVKMSENIKSEQQDNSISSSTASLDEMKDTEISQSKQLKSIIVENSTTDSSNKVIIPLKENPKTNSDTPLKSSSKQVKPPIINSPNEKDITISTTIQTKSSSSTSPTIQYKEGQWSPSNPNGNKCYDRTQLLTLRDSPASRALPQVNKKAHTILIHTNHNQPQSSLLPAFAHNSNKRQNASGGSVQVGRNIFSSGNNKQFTKQTSTFGVPSKSSSRLNKSGMIHVSLSLREEVKLNETENAWRPTHLQNNADLTSDIKAKEDLLRNVRGILNKLTPEKFDILVQQIMKLRIDTPEKMIGVMEMVFEKAIDEPNFSVSYAKLCQRLAASKLQCARKGSSPQVVFKNALLDKTQREFNQNVLERQAKENKLKPTYEKIKSCTDPDKKLELLAMLDEQERKIRRKFVGTVRFIGELFKISMLTHNIIRGCINSLLDPFSEDKLECLCKLLTTVGKQYEHQVPSFEKGSEIYNLDNIIKRMQSIVDRKTEKRISSRVRFMLQDVIDLRQNNWSSKHTDIPTTMEEIQKEAKAERLSSQASTSSSLSSKDYISMSSYSQSNKDYKSMGGQVKREFKRHGDNWTMQSSKCNRDVDANKLSHMINRDNDNQPKLGASSQFQWIRGGTTSTTAGTAASSHDSSTTNKNNNGGARSKKIFGAHIRPARSIYKDAGPPQTTTTMTMYQDDNDTINRLIKELITKAYEQEIEECPDVMKRFPITSRWKFFNLILCEYLYLAEATTMHIKLLSNVFVMFFKRNLLTIEQFRKGYLEYSQIAHEIIIDVPEAWKCIFQFIQPLLYKRFISIRDLWNDKIDKKLGKKFIKDLIIFCTKEIGPDFTMKMWRSSGFKWSDFMPIEDVDKFIKDSNFGFIEINDTVSNNIPSSLSPIFGNTEMAKIMDRIKELLNEENNRNLIVDYINGNISVIDKEFIRGLTETLCDYAIQYIDKHYKLAKTKFQETCIQLLRRYIDSKEDFELECLFAIQSLMCRLEHPAGLVCEIFGELYDCDVITQDMFIIWKDSKEELSGKGVLIKQLHQFFNQMISSGANGGGNSN